jgi:TrmH family RNA methyltransferase
LTSIVLIHPRNPLNIGAVARAMSNFGFFDLRLVAPYDLAYREAKSAVKSHYVLENSRVFATTAEAIGDASLVVGTASLGHRDLHLPLERLETGALRIRQHAGKVALIFGSEKFGLSNEDLSHCHALIRIPTRDEHESMNLAQAVAICCYELIRDDAALPTALPTRTQVEAADLQRFEAGLLQALELSGYVQERGRETTSRKLRSVFRRLPLTTRELVVFSGMVRQILWKLKSK